LELRYGAHRAEVDALPIDGSPEPRDAQSEFPSIESADLSDQLHAIARDRRAPARIAITMVSVE